MATKRTSGKRKAVDSDEKITDHSDNISAANSRNQSAMSEAQAAPSHQNKRNRVLKHVAIPKMTGDALVVDHDYSETSSRSNSRTVSLVQTPNVVAASQTRPRRSLPRPSYVPQDVDEEEPDDELANPNTTEHRAPHTGSDAPSENSEYEADDQSDESSDVSIETSDADDASEENHESSDRDVIPANTRRQPAVPEKTNVPSFTRKPSAKRMKRITARDKSKKGLDFSLAPLSDIGDIFTDMTKRALGLGFNNALKHLESRTLRVATMCSGTESPMLALQMIEQALGSDCTGTLKVEHLFSAEIVPYKQAYIERNFNPPIIFRDVTELIDAVRERPPMATTAYGSKVPVPMNVDILLAGTSCVDFSRLNKTKKGLKDGGESGKTWHAVLEYCKTFRPPIVILENVFNAEWDAMIEQYEEADYEAAGVLVDSKDYYIPHTRQRGYMVCFDKTCLAGASVGSTTSDWQSLMDKFRRYASSPVSSFLLPSDQVLIRDQSRPDDNSREVDWSQCEITQMQYRQEKKLGNARPFTNWSESGAMIVPENGSRSWFHAQVERVLDTIDACILRKALTENGEFDARYKTRLWNLSQNVYREEDRSPFGITGCITPSGIFFISDLNRALTPEESIRMQGIPLERISFTTESGTEIQDLAGNAMTTTVVGSAILAALIAGHTVIKNPDERDSQMQDPLARIRKPELQSAEMAPLEYFSNEDVADMPSVLQDAQRAMRRCYCESAVEISRFSIQQCLDCSHTTCTACGGNPVHNYRQRQKLTKDRIDPKIFESSLRSKLPLRLELGQTRSLRSLAATSEQSKKLTRYFELVNSASTATFTLSHFRRTHCMSVIYRSPKGRLELVIDNSQIEWRLFVEVPKELPSNDWLRLALTQPVAKAAASQVLLGSAWSWRVPVMQNSTIRIKGHGTRIPSWWSRNEMPEFRNHRQWEYLSVEILSDTNNAVDPLINGTYRYLPRCGKASDSLYKKTGSSETLPVYMFLDPSRVGPPKEDGFVFSTNKSSLEYDEVRLTLAQIESSWRPWGQDQEVTKATVTTDGLWIPDDEDELLHPASSRLMIYKPVDIKPTFQSLHCNSAATVISCSEVPSYEPRSSRTGNQTIDPENAKFFSEYAWVFEAMRRHLTINDWLPLSIADVSASCQGCNPTKPVLRWKLANDGKAITPYEDPSSAAQYERSIKARLPLLYVEFNQASSTSACLQLCVSAVSLAHRARSHLPRDVSDISFKWRLVTNASSARSFNFRPFRLDPTKNIQPFEDKLDMTCELFPKQRLSLAWMQGQEAGQGMEFMLEAAEDATLSKLGWRVEMLTQATIHVRGGICADHPGFGKTITSLALIMSQFQKSGRSGIEKELKARQKTTSPGLIPIAATLIVCPNTLLEQWRTEISEKLKWKSETISISTITELKSCSIEKFKAAKIILVNRSLLGSGSYAEHLAAFAGLPGPATNRGRALAQWLKFAAEQMPEHLRILEQSGPTKLRQHIATVYSDRLRSSEFEAAIPSRRLRGKDFAQKKPQGNDMHKKAASGSIDTSLVCMPLLEMFYFNRIIMDEFHQYKPEEYAGMTALRADKTWGLSATPALGDFYDVAQMAGLLGVTLPIGSLARGIMRQNNIRNLRKDMTDFECFDAMRQTSSSSQHRRIYEMDQRFLDTFVRRNILDFEELKHEDHLVPAVLDLDHRAIYTELSQHLNSLDMRIKKVSKSKNTDREERVSQAVDDSATAEEALSKTAAFFDRTKLTVLHQQSGIVSMIDRRSGEIDSARQRLLKEISQAKCKEPDAFQRWIETRIVGKTLGDEETISSIEQVYQDGGSVSRQKLGHKLKKQRRSKKNEDGDAAESNNASENDNSGSKEGKRFWTSEVNATANRMLVSIRSLRFLKSVQMVQESVNSNRILRCDDSQCAASSTIHNIAVSALCGHSICGHCFTHLKKLDVSQCRANGCTASMRDHHLLWNTKMGNLRSDRQTKFGAKVEAAVDLLSRIQQQNDQAVLFVQYGNQLQDIKQALQQRNITAVIVEESKKAGQQIADFRSNANAESKTKKQTVIVLNASDETAAGSNLQNANHVIFLSPLLRDTQYGYESTMAQAIGRVRRHGQKKLIYIYRIFAFDTIDVDILEHRERRTNAITEQRGPEIRCPPGAGQLDKHGETMPERTQLVRENGRFSLRPRSWLVRSDTEDNDEENDRVKGKSRIGGWEDFSSLVKFSRAYTEDDD